jgi:DNA ligase-1
MAFDLLEADGRDLRPEPLRERRARLAALVTGRGERLSVSPAIDASSREELRARRQRTRELGVEGLMLKRWSSPYLSGRPRGAWFKYKIEPYAIDAVLVYAQPGHGRRATLMTDLTFALRDGAELVPVAKAYSGLTDEEIDRLDRWIRQNTLERFGPVRAVKPVHVFELHFEGIGESTRHKSGIAVRFPRIARWRTDKKPEDADTLDSLRALLKAPR